MGLLPAEADAVKRAVAEAHGVTPDQVQFTGGLSFDTGYRQNSIWIPKTRAVGSARTDREGVSWDTRDDGGHRSGRA